MKTELTTAWDFVEKYYPNYDSSDVIAYNGDLCKLYHEEYDDGDCSHQLLIEDYGGEFNTTSRRQIESDFNESTRIVYERAIENYLETLND
jgi:hypothetical protein